MGRPGTLEMRGPLAAPSSEGAVRIAVAICSLGAAWIHVAVTAEHMAEYWLFGAFFAVVGALQALWAIVLLVRPSTFVYLSGAAANAGIVAIWVASRTIGMPLGPEPWTPEPLGIPDLLSTGLELVIVAGAAKLIVTGSTRLQVTQAGSDRVRGGRDDRQRPRGDRFVRAHERLSGLNGGH